MPKYYRHMPTARACCVTPDLRCMTYTSIYVRYM